MSKHPDCRGGVSADAPAMRTPWISYGLLLASVDFVLLVAGLIVASEAGPRYLALPFVDYVPPVLLLTGTTALALISWGLIDRFWLHRGQEVARSPTVLQATIVLAGVGVLALVWLAVFGDKCIRLTKQQEEALGAHDYQRAIELSTSLIDMGNDYGFLLRSRAHAKSGDLDSAIADVSEQLRQLDDYPKLCPDSYIWRAALFLKKHDDNSALRDLSKAIECDPSKWNVRAYYARAAVYRRLGRQAEAEKDFTAAKQLEVSGPSWARVTPWSRPYDEPDEEYVFDSRR